MRVRILALPLGFSFLLAAVPAFSAEPAGPKRLEVNYTEFTLPNGLNVILHEDHTIPFVCVDVWHYVGSAREKPGRTGFAHLFEHIMFEGSKNVKEGEFDRLLEAAGGDTGMSTCQSRGSGRSVSDRCGSSPWTSSWDDRGPGSKVQSPK